MISRRFVANALAGGMVASIMLPTSVGVADHTPPPASVAIAGSLQSELGCPGDWQPECTATELGFDADDGVWQGSYNVPAGSWEYKAALADSWVENYGAGGIFDGPNIALTLGAATDVKFYYDHETHWVTDNVNSTIATVAGSFQGALGCPGDWQPDCLQSWMQDPDGDGIYVFETDQIPAGSYEFKVALAEAWTTAFPADNVPFSSAENDLVTFTYDTADDSVDVAIDPALPTVTIVGSLQDELGCPADWQPDCTDTHLDHGAEDGVYQRTFNLPAGSYEYKAALNDSWDENYGANAQFNGPNIPLALAAATDVKFYFDDTTNWVTDNVNSTIATVAGSFQSELGCSGDWQPWCLRSWMQDIDGDGIYTFATNQIPDGNYEFRVALDEDWAVGHPAGNVAFTAVDGATVTFSYDSSTHEVMVDEGAGTVVDPGDELLARPPVRQAAQDDIFYFVMPDRFDNGDPGNDTAGDLSGDSMVHGFDPEDKGFYHGGDLAGLTNQLPYLDGLGVTAIWMTPQFTNKWVQDDGTPGGISAGYHGYWQTDYSSIDPHFGTNAEMATFVSAAHALGIDVYFDIVANHTGDVITYAEGDFPDYVSKSDVPYVDENGAPFDDRDYAGTGTFPVLDPAISFPYTPTFNSAPDETAKSPAFLNDPANYHNRGNSTFTGENSLYGDFFGLDDLFTEKPEVQDGLIQVFKDMVSDFDIDGFRIDTVKHVNDEFWHAFGPELEAHAAGLGKPDFFMFGEIFDSNPAATSRFSTELPLDAVLDFGFQSAALGFASRSAATDQLRDFYATDDLYTDADSNAYSLPTFLGNHDMGRVGFFLRDDNPGAPDAELVARDRLAHALMYFGRGMPVIYYGDEQGFVGDGGDKDARQDMMPSLVDSYNDDDLIGTSDTTADANFDLLHPLYGTLQGYGALVDAHAALRRGAQLHRYSGSGAGIYAFSRIERAEQVEYVVALNNDLAADSATFRTDSNATSFTEIWPGGGPAITSDAAGNVTVDVPGLDVKVYRADAPISVPSIAPVVTMTAPPAGAELLDRIEVGASLSLPGYAEVTFVVSTDGGTTYEHIGTDENAPYRVFYDVSDLPAGTPLEFKAIADNMSGSFSSDNVAAVVGAEEPPAPGGFDYAVVHYNRPNPLDGYGDHTTGDFNDFWGLHLWGDGVADDDLTEWTTPKPFLGEDEFGRFAWIERGEGPTVNFIVHRGDSKDTPDDRSFDADQHPEIWINQGDATVYTSQADAQGYATIRYHRDDGDYGDPTSPDFNDFWGVHLWGDGLDPSEPTDWPTPKPPTGFDDYGAFWNVLITDSSEPANFIIHRGDTKDVDPDLSFVPIETATVWMQSGDATVYPSRGAAENVATIHYHRDDGDYGDPTSTNFDDFWGMHVWSGAADPNPAWTDPVRWEYVDVFGPAFEIDIIDGDPSLSYIIHRGDTKDPGPDQSLLFDKWGYEVWQLEGEHPSDPDEPHYVLPILGSGGLPTNIGEQRAHWVAADTIVWEIAGDPTLDYELCHAPTGGMTVGAATIEGGSCVDLTPGAPYPSDVDGFLHLGGLPTLRPANGSLGDVPSILTGQFAVQATDGGVLLGATGLQIPGVLDDLFSTEADLGVVWNGRIPTINLWAPTAKSVTLRLYDNATTADFDTVAMTNANGVWSATGARKWKNKFYLYEVEVYVPSTGAVETNVATDPYSLSLSMNSTRTQIVDLDDRRHRPSGWNDLEKPELERPEDISIYELHVRDFSISDETVPAGKRGTYAAFTKQNSDGMRHLAELAEAGLSHVHLLPVFDIATINENAAERTEPDPAVLATYPPDSEEQQAAVIATADLDGFNWGYDPFHYTTPEGSYSTNPDGPRRIREFRQMVESLNETGLRVVMDVVYNHTNASGQTDNSVLDQIVPGYYHRLDEAGAVTTSTCCANTATEHEMMGKLMIDSVVTWAREYKVDGFRFDLMGHHSKQNLLDVRAALDALTLADDGVDGSSIYLYGEGWNFGEVADNARFVQATQLEMNGTGIGTFSDRLRDAVRGGGPFDDGQSLLDNQGYINGLWYDGNGGLTDAAALDELLLSGDQIRIGLAGNLAEYEFVDRNGDLVTGKDVDYNGAPAGYTADPQENIVYIAAHDNQTLFDIGQYHHPVDTTMDERVRAQNVGNAIVALAQGVPFFHAGQDMLRSKSLDRDSYNSGDWFNRLDFTYQSNNWGVGLPVAEKNESNWPIQGPLLANPDLVPEPGDIERNVDVTGEWLEVRDSTPLFRLETAADVQARLSFLNTGPAQVPGVIAMQIVDPSDGAVDLDADLDRVVAVFNPTAETIDLPVAALAGSELTLHPVLADSADSTVMTSSFEPATGTFSIPARTAAVFIEIGPDTTPPEAAAALTPIKVSYRVGWFRVGAACTDDRGVVTTEAALNGFGVVDDDLVRLITTKRGNRHTATPWFHIFRAPSFELTVTCIDAAGNVSTATAIAEFRQRHWHGPR